MTTNRADLEGVITADLQGATTGTGRPLSAKEIASVARIFARDTVEREEYRAGCAFVVELAAGKICPDCGSGSWSAKGIRTMGDNPENIFFVECKVCGWSERYGTPKKVVEGEKRGRKAETWGT